MNKIVKLILCSSFLVLSCEKGGSLFYNPTPKQTGIDFTNSITETEELNILDYLYFYNGGGVAVGDINNDQLPDIFFTGNQVKNKLYLNKGNLQFEDISVIAGVEGNSSWNTGAVMGDINGDGLLDIYVCAVVGIKGFNGHNELYINNGDNTFTESAADYGLDLDSYSSSAAFFDYDLDGDLDMYLLNHAVHNSESFGNVDLRYQRSDETGDKLMRNDNGNFVDVSESAGILGGINSYGLGVATADFNQDGYPDIYVGNDFHEDDYYYLNNGDGTFTESLRNHFGHTTRFSMGNDVADINNDGLPDLISLDMLPEEELPLKSSEGDDNVQIQKLRIERYGYHYQFTRNMLYVNQPDGNFVETALMSGIAATDWSWSALFADYDQDGMQDVFIANGITKRPNDLDFIKFVSSDQIKNKISNTKLVDQKALDMMPSGSVHNYIFKGADDMVFQDKSSNWIGSDTLVSGASALGDFDNDGDIDIVVNNLNAAATLYVNKTDAGANYLKINFDYLNQNKLGIGTKVYVYTKGGLQFKELFPARGFQASSEPLIHFGFGKLDKIDSLKVIWPNKTYQVLFNIAPNQTLTITPDKTKPFDYETKSGNEERLFKKTTDNLGIDFGHIEDNYVDFNRENLMPYKISDRGPAFAYGDLNNDSKKDIFFGGSKFIAPMVFVQQDSTYTEKSIAPLNENAIKEDVTALIADFNGDSKNDLITGSGGGDFFGESAPLTESLFLQSNDGFELKKFPELFQNTSIIRASDYDNDGDLDLFVGGQTVTGSFGGPIFSYLMNNDKGTFTIDKSFTLEGMVTDALWDDFDQDGVIDLIVVGEWMSPQFFKNNSGNFTRILENELIGLWQRIVPFDIDHDGNQDYLLGNWGTNSKFKASKEKPLKMFFNDFDGNGQTETILAIEKNGSYYTLEGLDELASQMVFLRKKFNSYTAFAGKPIDEIVASEVLENSKVWEVNTLHSGYLKNDNGTFNFVPFKNSLQVSPLMDFLVYDFDDDGKQDVLLGGNYFGVKPYHGRFDSFPGALIKDENTIILGNLLGLDFTQKSIRHLSIISLEQKEYLLAVFNNDKAQVYELTK
ncbi:MAG: VCBS repeat-containing protein [Croceitalea sp.]|nr:VCBS repeat-containing protein [Croceitalea sp.]